MNIKELFSQSLTFFLMLCAIIIIFLVVRREFNQPELDYNPLDRMVENWKELDLLTLPVNNGSNSDSSLVQIIKFYDYQCPYCKQVQPSVHTILEKYTDDVSLYYAHLPLKSHIYAHKASIAAECARNQGSFKDVDSLLFSLQDQLGTLNYVELAHEAGVRDISSFSQCLDNEQTKSILKKGIKLAQEINIVSIPTFIINGRVIPGALTEESLINIVEEELAKIKK